MKKLYFTLISLFLLSVSAFAQVGEIQGKVIDEKTGNGIGYAPVTILQNGTQRGSTLTDNDGNYIIKPVTPGTYVVKVTYVSYQPYQVNDVDIKSDGITYLNVKMEKVVNQIKPIVITAEKKLVDPGQVSTGDTKTRTEIQQLATNRNNPNDIVGTAAGVFQSDNGGAINVGGGRTYNNRYYVDGIPMRGTINLPSSSIEQLTLVTGGVPSRYGDATSGIISITTRGPSSTYGGGLEFTTSSFLDGFGYNLVNMNFSGPIVSKNKKTDSAQAKIGFFLSAEYEGGINLDPPATEMYKVKSDVLENLKSNPIRPSQIGLGFDQSALYLTNDDLELTKTKQNSGSDAYRLTAKLDFKLSKYMNLTIGGNADIQQFHAYDYSGQLLASNHNDFITDKTYRGFVRFRQNFADNTSKDKKSASVFQNPYYTIQLDYTKFIENVYDDNIGKNPFEYGYIGKFQTYKAPAYLYGTDTATGLNAIRLVTYTDTLATFQPSNINPELAAYTTSYYTLSGSTPVNGVYGLNGSNSFLYSSVSTIQNIGGLINGFLPGSVYSLWSPIGSPAGNITTINNTQYRVSFSGSVDIVSPSSTKGDKNRHAIEFGFEYEQRDDRRYSIFPFANNGLYNRMFNLTNTHIKDLDLSNPILKYSQDGTFLDTILYNRFVNTSTQSFFDFNLRNKLGAAPDEFIDIHNLSPETFSIDMFSPDELTTDGNQYVFYYGYDWKGNRLNQQPSFDDFFTKTETINGREINTRPIGAFQPIYAGAYLQDQFNFKDLIFNVGLRVDRYDANQKVLKSDYSLYPIRTVGEVSSINGNEITHPDNIKDDFYVYVNSPENPSAVLGYRNNDTWYDANGTEIADPKILAQSTSFGKIAPYLQEGFKASDNFKKKYSNEGFEDYVPQISIMPRIAFSFPISDEALLFAHYDILTQRPTNNRISPFTYYYFTDIVADGRFANPNLKPEKTIDYQVGYKQLISENSALTISATYKELKNMVQARNILYAIPTDYKTYGNVDFGTVKSLQVSYEMRRPKDGNLRMDINYTLQFAEGTGSDQTSGVNLINSGSPNLRTIVPFSYDQRHTLIVSADYRYGEGKKYNGPVVGKNRTQIFKNTGLNGIFRVGSGTPFSRQLSPTPDAQFGVATQSSLKGNINGSRLPYTFKVDLKLDRDFVLISKKGTSGQSLDLSNKKNRALYINAYLLVQNVFNTRNIVGVYSFTGSASDDGYLTSAKGIQETRNTRPSAESFADLYSIKVLNPDNFTQPRLIRFGLSLNF